MEPNSGDEKLFTLLALAYDVKSKFGFTLIVHNKLFDQLRFIQRALLQLEKVTDLVFIERFKVIADKKGNNAADNNSFDYFAALKIKIPRGVTVSANQVKQELEI